MTFHQTDWLSAEWASGARLQIRKAGHGVVCNVSRERIVDAGVWQDPATGLAWLALHGCMNRVDFARRQPNTGLVGPFPEPEARALAKALTEQARLPRSAAKVRVEDLERDPRAWNEKLVTTECAWEVGKDRSFVANAWLLAPEGNTVPNYGKHRVRVTGFWRCSGQTDFEDRLCGHGPFQLAPAELDAMDLVMLA